ncbi:hypothetical protein COY12_00905 [Candidatus Roizmanbacteria bacterium CG_4_10_14_0_2_um_filter_33_96]|uniref:LytR/CpsA/Psr regulator C-terminal domain-containing protein n=1 Tax=Candidatus Roizmanbacteria bacterium CG_4_10_14_0_2_um_filter_33_96 TaxID=1974821 RepID=A0A2M7U9U0_9BACT|nr:MAG: hypothetical protein COY12_00905 [Candidatus Roizmanbacteria bacterium CG_4_10_14_0_2_um_filter_33_96]
MKMPSIKKNKIIRLPRIIYGLITLTIIIAGIAFYYFNNIHLIKSNFDINLLGELEKIINLSEKPQVTTITDMKQQKANNPDFLKDGKDGFKILQFANGAILYDPYQNKIVNISANGALFREKIKPLKVALRFNDNESGQVKQSVLQFKGGLAKSFPQISFTEVSPSNATYTADVIYLVNRNRRADAIRMSEFIGGSPLLENLESDESVTDADIIIAFHKLDNIE